MFSWLKRWFRRRPPPEPEPESSAAHAGEEPGELHHGRHRLKERYTSHWDLDYLSQDELEKLMDDDADKNKRDPPS